MLDPFPSSLRSSSVPWAVPFRWLDSPSVVACARKFGVPVLLMIWRRHIAYVHELDVLTRYVV